MGLINSKAEMQISSLIGTGLYFFFSSRRRHTRLQGDWSSDVCSSDLVATGLSWLCYYRALHLANASMVADDPPFATFIHVDRNTGALTWRGSVTFADATNGAEQPVWHPGTGRFYISIPQIGANPQDGAVKRINTNGTVEATYPVTRCQPAGLTDGPNGD